MLLFRDKLLISRRWMYARSADDSDMVSCNHESLVFGAVFTPAVLVFQPLVSEFQTTQRGCTATPVNVGI